MEFLNVPGQVEIFENIAKYLSTGDLFSFRCCSRLCKELADLGLTKHKRLALGSEGADAWDCPPLALQVIIEKCKALQEINIELKYITDNNLHSLIRNNNNLKRVYMRNCFKITDEGFLTVLQCKKLKSLIAENCNDSFLEGLVQRKILLEEIEFWGCLSVSIEGFISFIKQQPLLRYITLPLCFEDNRDDENRVISAIISHCKNLELICTYTYTAEEDYIDAGRLQRLAEGCPNLRIISLPEAKKMLMSTFLYFQNNNRVRLVTEDISVYEFNGEIHP